MARIGSGTLTVVIFATLLGLGGAFVVRQQLHQPRTSLLDLPEPAPQSVIVPTAAVDLPMGQSLSINEIALIPVAPERFSTSRYAGVQYMRSAEQIAGRTLRRALKKGEPFLPEDFYPGGAGPQIVDRLPPGFRAVTVPIENVGAVHGFAGPGSVVDVLFRSRPEGDRPEVTLTLLEGVEVLALDHSVVPGQQVALDSTGSVTLSVTPQQAKVLKVVESRGELSLTLRSDDDIDLLPRDVVPMNPFLGRIDPNPAAEPISLRTDSHSAGTLNGLVSTSLERVTLDDLLGLPPTLPKRQMEIYLGPDRTIVEFERSPEVGLQLLQNGGRIPTPIASDQLTVPGDRRQAARGRAGAPALVTSSR